MNVLIPACGNDRQFQSEYWAKNVTEINGKPMIQYVIENFASIPEKKYIVILNESECARFHTDNMVRLLTGGNCEIIRLHQQTRGALCTSLLAVDQIDNEDELIISNNDQKYDCGIENLLNGIREQNADGGVVTFECIHPRWSYVRMENGAVVEASEKRPISRKAIAGLYYFKHGKDFVSAAKQAIIKNRSYDGKFYISASINEMILLGKTIKTAEVLLEEYHSFYEPKQIEKYEMELHKG